MTVSLFCQPKSLPLSPGFITFPLCLGIHSPPRKDDVCFQQFLKRSVPSPAFFSAELTQTSPCSEGAFSCAVPPFPVQSPDAKDSPSSRFLTVESVESVGRPHLLVSEYLPPGVRRSLLILTPAVLLRHRQGSVPFRRAFGLFQRLALSSYYGSLSPFSSSSSRQVKLP